MTPKQTDSELWAMFSNGDGTMGQVGFRDSLHQREQQIYAELMEKAKNIPIDFWFGIVESANRQKSGDQMESYTISAGEIRETIINNIFKHE